MNDHDAIISLIDEGGALCEALSHFEVREGQKQMLRAVLEAYDQETVALIEAGTGIGKTMAYLLAAIFWAKEHGQPTVIATHTIALQEQILHKDLPLLLDALDLDLKAVLVKGMHNYLCLRKFERHEADLPEEFLYGVANTSEGTRSSLPVIDNWEEVAAEKDSCTHHKCSYFKECHFFRARKETEDAQILVANHHLLFADLSLRAEHDDEVSILPEYERVILDEAHHIEEVAFAHFAKKVEKIELLNLLVELAVGRNLLDQVHQTFDAFVPRFEGEEHVRITEPLRGVTELIEALRSHLTTVEDLEGESKKASRQIDTLALFADPIEKGAVRWVERSPFRLVHADLDIAPKLAKGLFEKMRSVVLCSATLSVRGSFGYVKRTLGIEEAIEEVIPSPFDYSSNVQLHVPLDLPEPSAPGFAQHASEQIFSALEAAGGNSFVLFTSYQMLRECRTKLEERLAHRGYTLFCQGDEGRSLLLGSFRKAGRAVLFGTDTFWEGVDVVGDDLRQVIIVKLPFKSPSDPLFAARSEKVAQEGGSPFFDYSLPQAVMKFKQGFGRLIRSSEDRGCIVCLDRRLVKKGYGKIFLRSLPKCARTFAQSEQVLAEMRNFYAS